MCPKAIFASLFLLVIFATLHFGCSWIEEGINEEFYSLSVVDAMGDKIPMSSYIGKVMAVCLLLGNILQKLV